MKLQDQVIGLNQAIRLKLLGVIQKSLFYHHPAFDKPVFGETWTTQTGKQYAKTMVCNDKKGAASAFTVAELGVMLGTEEWSTNYKKQNIFYWDAELFALPFGPYPTEAEARAAILIHLLENKLITADEVNKRLTCQ